MSREDASTEPAPSGEPDRAPPVSAARVALIARSGVALGQCATVYATWPLWEQRASPPTLPLGSALPVSFGAAMIATALSAIALPRAGSAAHFAVLLVAMMADQCRVQPSAWCFAVLLIATGWGPRAWVLARCYLASLWFFAGLNKLLSPGWFTGTAPWLLTALTKAPSPTVTKWFPWVIAGGEMLLGLLALAPRTRRLAAVGAVAMHLGILYDLGPLGHRWNRAVWPWNLALALLAPLLLWPHRGTLREEFSRAHPVTRALCAAALLGPLLWHVGLCPPYLAHHLYSEDLPAARWCDADNRCVEERGNDEVYAALQVPLPPSVHTIRAHFEARCLPGDTLEVRDPRRWFIRRAQGRFTLRCPRR